MLHYMDIGVIGGADGPTAIYVTGGLPLPLTLILIAAAAAAVGGVIGYFVGKNRK